MSRLLTILLLFTCFAAKAQTRPSPKDILTNEQLLVKDSTGKVLKYKEWRPLIATGDYVIRSIYRAKDTTYTLRHITPEEKAKFAAMRTTSPPVPSAQPGPQAPRFNPDDELRNPPTPSESFPVGAKLNMLSAKDMDGKWVDNKAVKGKIVVLNFWFIGCPPCKAEIPELNKLVADNAADPDIIFVAVGLDRRWEINDFIKTHPFNYRQIAEARRYCDGYGIKLYPTNVIIDKQGVIRYSAVGYGRNYMAWMKKTIKDIKNEN